MTEELKAQYSALPFQSGDGYGFGGAAVVAIGDMAVLVGEGPKAHSLAKQLAAAWNTRAPSTELTQLVKAARENAETLRRIQDSLSRYLEPDGDIKNAISAVNAVLEIADHKDTLAKQRALIAALASFKEVE